MIEPVGNGLENLRERGLGFLLSAVKNFKSGRPRKRLEAEFRGDEE
jgi:hypothetical protein